MFAIPQWLKTPLQLAVVVAAIIGAPVMAEQNPYVIRGVEVEVTGGSATEAREAALQNGEREAYRQLVEEYVPRQHRETLMNLPPEQIRRLIQGFEVQNEKITSDSYQAKLTYTFNKAEVDALLDTSGSGYIAPQNARTLILPLLRGQNEVLLWEDDNPWRQAWEEFLSRNNTVPAAIPLGDITDIATAPAQVVERAHFQQLKPLAARYHAGDILIAEASFRKDINTGQLYLEVIQKELGRDNSNTDITHYAMLPDKPRAEVFSRAVLDISRRILQDARGDADYGSNRILALVPIASIKDWVEIRNRLQQVPEVEEVELGALSNMQADVRLKLAGKPQQVTPALHRYGLYLTQENGYWVLRLGNL